jgi:hypothetical protein
MGRKQSTNCLAARPSSLPSSPIGNSGIWRKTVPPAVAVAIALFILSRMYLVLALDADGYDILRYWDYASKAIDQHQTPYQENFEIEYPPPAFWVMAFPRVLDQRRIEPQTDPRLAEQIARDYRDAFRLQMFFLDLISFACLLLIVRGRRPQLAGWAAILYVVTTTIFCRVLYDRLDVGLLALLLLAAYAWTRSLRDSPRTVAWSAAAYLLIGLSISYKIVPIVCVPFLLLAEWHSPLRRLRLTAALAAGVVVPFAIQGAISGAGVFYLFKHHAEREIQIESLYATFMWIASCFGSPVFVTHAEGAYNLSGSLAPATKVLSVILLVGLPVSLGIWALFRGSRYSRQDAYRLSCYVIAAAVILSNVLSPQFFLWAIPLLLLMAVEVLPAGRASPWVLGVFLIAVAAMSTWIFPYHYFCTPANPHGLIPLDREHLTQASNVAYLVLGARNLIYLGIVSWLGVMLFRRTGEITPNTEKMPI